MKVPMLWIGLAMLCFVCLGFYCAEFPIWAFNSDETFAGIGYVITAPGQAVVAGLLGNIHASYGDWRDPCIKIGVSYVVWLIPTWYVVRTRNIVPRGTPDSNPRPKHDL